MAGAAMSKGRTACEVELNIVPLVDMVCVLILFFILTSQISSANLANLRVPDPVESQARKIPPEDEARRVVVNVVCNIPPGAEKKDLSPAELSALAADSRYAKEYQIGGLRYPCEPEVAPDVAKEKLLEAFRAAIRTAMEAKIITKEEEYSVEVRGDARVMALYMNPILQAAAEANMNKISITAMEGKN